MELLGILVLIGVIWARTRTAKKQKAARSKSDYWTR